ncbi:MAG TPA: FAD-dependent oxidoreductase, partial [Flavobacteriales bacterium]|nr:FAD-dependent oxidoreductase [Flavobacteriales bacterium]
DTAVVGAGLAGCTLAFQLKQAGHRVLLIDQPALSSSSRIAAGVYNPIVFKRTTLAWKAKETIVHCIDFYDEVQQQTKSHFHVKSDLYRILSGYEEQNEWVRKSGMAVYDLFMEDVVYTEPLPHCVSPFGYTRVKNTGYILTNEFMHAVKSHVGTENCLAEQFNPLKLTVDQTGFTYGTVKFNAVVFCEGHLVLRNPWFDHVQLYPVKGEIIEIENRRLESDTLYSSGVYMLVQPNGLIKIGGTYDWNHLDEVPTESGRNELLDKTRSFFMGEIHVKSHRAGIRPAVKDRRPIVGRHHQFKNMYILNGMGTKGVSLAPWCAQQLVNLIEKDIPVDKEIDVNRFI